MKTINLSKCYQIDYYIAKLAKCEKNQKLDQLTFFALFDFHKFKNGILHEKKGCFFWLSKKLNKEQAEEIEKTFKNVIILKGTNEFAPEICSNVVFLSKTKF